MEDDFPACADVFLLPSQTESFGLAALEALSCGVPVVASHVGGVPEVISHGEDGLLAPAGDVSAMAAHVLSLTTSKERWQLFSKSARAGVVARFQRPPAIDRYEALYRRVVGQ
jgi:glycosyltransferase involved in cell wall biosynthesis